jgi:type IV pilus assembly protein PilQ
MLLPATGASTGSSTGGASGIMTGAASSSGSSGSSSSGSSSSSSSGSSSSGNMKLNTGTVACTLKNTNKSSVSALGVQNLSVAYYSQLGTVSIIGGSDNQLEMIKEFIASTDKKQPQAYLEVSIVELNENGRKELSNSWTLFSKFFSASFDGTTSSNPLYPTFLKGDGYRIVEISDEGEVKEKYSVSKYTGPVQLSYMINYLIQNGKARVVVNPRIVITNGVQTKIDVTQDYLESVEINTSTSTSSTVTTRDYNISNDQGVQVSITPFISPDGYVTLNITPQYSTPVGTITGNETVNNKTIEYTAATLLSHRNLDLKNIRIKDGETLVIAGMIQENETKSVSKVPVLGDLPVIGTVFRNTTSQKVKNEMVILLTPKIITDNEDAVDNTDTL